MSTAPRHHDDAPTSNPATSNPATSNPATGNPATGNPATGNPATSRGNTIDDRAEIRRFDSTPFWMPHDPANDAPVVGGGSSGGFSGGATDALTGDDVDPDPLVVHNDRRSDDASQQPERTRHTLLASRTRRWAGAALLVLAMATLLASAAFWVTGGRWFSVATPSMGTTAPVGTLVLTRPVHAADLHVGDVIAFVPPTEKTVTYTHRIVAITNAGTPAATVTTRGDINGATDPWPLTQRDITGRTVLIAPGVGYLLRALPLWLIGGLVIFTLSRLWVRPGWRTPVRLLGGAVLYLTAALTIRPFLGIVQLVTTTDTDGTAHISAVSTGLLPVRLAPTAGHGVATPVDLTYGQTGIVNLHPNPGATGGSYQVAAHLHLSLWGWVLIIALWSLPTVLSLLLTRRRHRLDDTAAAAAAAADLATDGEAPIGTVSAGLERAQHDEDEHDESEERLLAALEVRT